MTHRFRDRADAARQLAELFKDLQLVDPLVLGIPRGGVVTGAYLAREIGADLDVALSRKLRHPLQQELAIGAVSENGKVFIDDRFRSFGDDRYLKLETERRMEELRQRREMFRRIRPVAAITGRSVILTDDGIATGSTMFAALQFIKAKSPHETIIAVPVAPPHQFQKFSAECDRAFVVLLPREFMAIGQFYEDFRQVDDQQVCELLREFAPVKSE